VDGTEFAVVGLGLNVDVLVGVFGTVGFLIALVGVSKVVQKCRR